MPLTESLIEPVRPAWDASSRPPPRPPTSPQRPLRVLLVGEAICLAHVGRPTLLARWAAEAGHEVHFACGPELAWVAREAGLRPIAHYTVSPATIRQRIAEGRFFYTDAELLEYVASDRRLLQQLAPDLVVSDHRLSMSVAAVQSGVEQLTLVNAHWSPASRARLPAPRGGFLGRLPRPLREALFAPLREPVLRYFPGPLHRMRRTCGQPPLRDMRGHFSAGARCAYLDLPELNPLGTLPKGHFYLGPLAWTPAHPPPPLDRLPPGRPLAYVTMGSSGNSQLLPTVLRALLAAGWHAAVSGVDEPAAAELLRKVPGLAEGWVHGPCFDPGPLLGRTDLTICHGGSGTVYQSLQYGVPLLCLPDNPDQGMVTAGVCAAGVGTALDPEQATPTTLEKALHAARDCAKPAREMQSLLLMWDTRSRWLTWLKTFADHRSQPINAPLRANR